MRRMTDSLLALALSAAALTAPLAGQQPQAPASPTVTEEKRGLFAKAKVTPAVAMATALAKVPGGHVTKGELEEEDGKLIYSFDIKVAGRRGIEEVHVDALTGAIIKSEHEAEDETPRTKVPTATKAPTATKRP